MSVNTSIEAIRKEIGRVVVGQHGLIDGLLCALICDGHVLVEGFPGLAKTTAVRTFARTLGLGFRRIQFTPDLLPADLLGTQVYDPATQAFRVHRGPIFEQVILADEINRAPAKVQSALLEAMEERQVTLVGETLPLPGPFLVMATQNPIEQEGVYPLPEAQLDRFMFKLRVDYPSADAEAEIVRRRTQSLEPAEPRSVVQADQIERLREAARAIHVEASLVEYAVALVHQSRQPDSVLLGASPRASIHLIEAARARALLKQREFALPEDIKAVAADVLRHRVKLTYEAEADGMEPDSLIRELLSQVPTP